ncbi:hypothetical protein [Mesonia aquimarina]|uniref:hypothetical protein n=1 Tax=Mesonia aquimarina TaxID=1504967 RepID=UPI000EF591A0|nr:hypothetical protein [Mesonia aquimarina]
MIKLKDIIIDRIKDVIPLILILSLPYYFEIINLTLSPLFIFFFFLLLTFFQLITSENYLIDYQVINTKITFTYKITLSKKIQKKEIDLNSVKKVEFQSKSNLLENFNGITVKYENIDKNQERFSLKIKSDTIWLQILNKLKV